MGALRWKRAKTHRGSRRRRCPAASRSRIYVSVVTIDPDQAGCCNRAGSIYIHTWHLDEMAVLIAGRRFWLWRAVDDEGEVLHLLVQRRRDKTAAVKLMRKLLKKHGFAPNVLVTDKRRSYAAAKLN